MKLQDVWEEQRPEDPGPQICCWTGCAPWGAAGPNGGALVFPVDRGVFRMLPSWFRVLGRWSPRWTPRETLTLVPSPGAGYSSPLHQVEAAKWPMSSPAGLDIHSRRPLLLCPDSSDPLPHQPHSMHNPALIRPLGPEVTTYQWMNPCR